MGPDPEDKGDDKPKRTAIPRGVDFLEVEIQMAIGLLDLPRDIGLHPEDNNMVQAHSGRFGPYIKHGKNTVSLPEPRDVLTIGLNHAITLLADKSKSRVSWSTLVLTTQGPQCSIPYFISLILNSCSFYIHLN